MLDVDAVLFDLDDTLVDWWHAIRVCVADLAGADVADVLCAFGAEHCVRRRDGIVVVRSPWRLHELADDLWPQAFPELDPGDLRLLVKRFREELWVGFFPDVLPALDTLEGRVRLGVLSNNHHLPAETERLRLLDWFDVAIAVPAEVRKPHPDAFLLGCEAMGTAPARTAYVGDSIELDVEGAQAAGLVPVWLDRWDDPWDPPADIHRITSLAQLPPLLT